jgi:S-DNA-T family DNA segregation ATPase FtsK/SpoIIIE
MKKTKNKKSSSMKHMVPDGFWSQVFSVVVLIFAVIMLIGVFGVKGWLTRSIIEIVNDLIGISTAIFTLMLAGLSLKRLFSKEGKLPISIIINSLIFIVMLSSIASILSYGSGGSIGDSISGSTEGMLSSIGSLMVFILIGAIDLMFIFSKTPREIYGYFKTSFAHTTSEDENGKTIKLSDDAGENNKSVQGSKFKLKNILVNKHKSEHFDGIQKSRTELKVRNNEDKAIPNSHLDSKKALTINRNDNWLLPETELLEVKTFKPDAGDIKKNAQIIKETLSDFKVEVEMEEANIGPRVTQFTLRPPSGVRLQKITALDTNIALNLAAESIRIEAPIPGKKAVGIEVPNRKSAIVTLRSVIESKAWSDSNSALSFAIGKDISGVSMVGELDVMPHLLIAGQTGSGKSIMINTFLVSLLYRNPPSELKLILVDPKRVELSPYNHILIY